MADQLQPFPADWQRGLAIVAHPDDMEYGAASAVARWTAEGKWIGYVLVTRGEAGIDDLEPDESSRLRTEEQIAGCAKVGVDTVDFLDHADGAVEDGHVLRNDLAAAIRRHRPDLLFTINHRDSWGGPSWNHRDHRVVGRAVLDAARDAANRWLFPAAGEAWSGVTAVAISGSPQPTHVVDIDGYLDAGVESLRCHERYLAGLGGDMADPQTFLEGMARRVGEGAGLDLAASFEVVSM